MKTSLILFVGWFIAHTGRADDEVEKALAQLRGTWELVKAEGKFEAKGLTFTGNSVVVETDSGKKEAPVRLNPTTKPPHIDMGEGQRKNLGIYSLEGDTLKICLAGFSAQRPTEFKRSENTILVTLRRAKQ
jgi:uncharacterized protein (TIGR03067 family)